MPSFALQVPLRSSLHTRLILPHIHIIINKINTKKQRERRDLFREGRIYPDSGFQGMDHDGAGLTAEAYGLGCYIYRPEGEKLADVFIFYF